MLRGTCLHNHQRRCDSVNPKAGIQLTCLRSLQIRKTEVRVIYYQVRCPVEAKLARQSSSYLLTSPGLVSIQPFSSEPSGIPVYLFISGTTFGETEIRTLFNMSSDPITIALDNSLMTFHFLPFSSNIGY